MNASVSSFYQTGNYPSFDALSHHLTKAQSFEGLALRLPFPQLLCRAQTPLIKLEADTLTPDNSFFQPLQSLIQQLNQQIKAEPPSKQVKTLQKIEAAYQAFITEVCQSSNEKRTQLLEVSTSFIHQLIQHNQIASLRVLIEQKKTVHEAQGIEQMVSLLLLAGEEPASGSDSSDLEGIYYKRFEEAYHQGEGFEQLFYLQKMSALYLKKGQLIVAANILNNALALANRLSFPETYQDSLLIKLEQIEARYIKELFGVTSEQQHYLKKQRQNLQEIRQSVQEKLKAGILITQIQKELTKSLQNILVKLIEESFNVIKEKPPTTFAIIGLGSMSREEMAPYSDVELAILIQESTESNKEFFRKFSKVLNLKIVNLGESKYDLVRSYRIGDCILQAESLTPHGFSLDSGGLSPLGKTGVYELIGTSHELVQFQTAEWTTKHEGEVILVNALTTCRLITGDIQLLMAYEKELDSFLNTKPNFFKKRIRETKALELLKGHLAEFQPFLGEDRLNLRAFDAKKDFYRPIQMMFGALSLYYRLRCKNTLDILLELTQRRIMSNEMAQKLHATLSQILLFRFNTQMFYQNAKETLYYSKTENNPEGVGLYQVKDQDAKSVLEIFRVLIPMYKLFKAFVDGKTDVFSHRSYYDTNIGKLDLDAEFESDIKVTESSCIQQAALNPNDTTALNNLQTIKLALGKVQETLKHNLDCLVILKNKHGNHLHDDIVSALNNIGTAYQDMGDFRKAVEYHEKSLTMCKELYAEKITFTEICILGNLGKAHRALGKTQIAISFNEQSLNKSLQYFDNKPHTMIVSILDTLGDAYNDLGNVQKAIIFYKKSLAMQKELNSNSQIARRALAITLNNLGNVYLNLRRFAEALDYYQQSLSINKQIFGDTPHPTSAVILSNLGVIYRNLEQVPKAIESHMQSLAMKRKLYGNKDHPDIADTLCNLGVAYTDIKDPKTAISYLDQSLTMMKKCYGESHLAISDVLSAIAMVFYTFGHLPEARKYFEESFQMLKDLYGDAPHPAKADVLSNLGTVYFDLGLVDQSMKAYMLSGQILQKLQIKD